MENASKALLMAGGLLAGILVITSLTIMWSKMSGVKASQSGNVKTEQLAEFNATFDSYANETVMGTDILSLFNKVVSNNQKRDDDVLLSNIQYEPITIVVSYNGVGWKDDYKALELIDGDNEIIRKDDKKNEKRNEKINEYIQLEKDVGRDNLTKLSTYCMGNAKERLNDLRKQIAKEKGLSSEASITREDAIKRIVGKSLSNITDKQIDDYTIYTTFKTSKYTCEKVEYSPNNGQVSKMIFQAK